jgi:23S rRNA (cytidine1920-2'-O)/16S rRNA (cytidine1409-2'-O)-methyltransferase
MDKGIELQANRLDKALVEQGFCESRTEAQELIDKGFVYVDGAVCKKQTKLITLEQTLEVKGSRTFVSRGGEKLLGALRDVCGDDDKIKEALQDKVILDVGSSTGGFTDCLLQYGATHIDAVDVGTDQMHHRVANNPFVSLYENTDIRNFKSKYEYDFIVADLSFISLRDVIDVLFQLGKVYKTHYFLLIKPQFEVGKGNTKKGIVKDQSLIEEVKENLITMCNQKGFTNIAVYKSHIQGGDGNQEYFLYAKL